LARRLLPKKPQIGANNLAGNLSMAKGIAQAKSHRITEKAFDCETNQVGLREPT
jgi:hypothetical protein